MPRIVHVTLTADQVEDVELDADYPRVEIVKLDADDEIYGRAGGDHTAEPTVAGDDCFVLPAAICSLEVDVNGRGATHVKLISSGTPRVSIEGVKSE